MGDGMTAYVIAVIFVLVIGAGLWLYRRGKRDARLKAAERAVGVAHEARKTHEDIRALSDAAVRSELRKDSH
jgi:ABC-type nickel/cobalt efflux system permease component RcnA